MKDRYDIMEWDQGETKLPPDPNSWYRLLILQSQVQYDKAAYNHM